MWVKYYRSPHESERAIPPFFEMIRAPVVNRDNPIGIWILWCAAAFGVRDAIGADQQSADPPSPVHSLVEQYCADCHNGDDKKGNLDLERIGRDDATAGH